MALDNITNYTAPQKISFKLSGGYGGNYPIDLRSTAAFMLYFQSLLDKSYCVIAHKSKVTQQDNACFRLMIKNLKVGSLSSDLLLVVEGASLALPLIGFCNPKSIWDYTCYSLKLATRFFSDVDKKIQPVINVNGNNNTIVYQANNTNEVYPLETYEIANKSIPIYRKLGSTIENGNFTSFTAFSEDTSIPPLSLNTTTSSLFKEKTVLDSTPIHLPCNIISFNKENLTGRLRSLDDSLLQGDFPFSVIGNQDPMVYLNAMHKNQVSLSVIKEVTYSSLTPRVKRLQVLSVQNNLYEHITS